MTGPVPNGSTGSRASRCLVEAVGTLLLVAIGTGAIVEGVRRGGVPQWVLALAWFSAVTVPVALCARRSGAHLNPVVTVSLALGGRIPWSEVPGYVAAQVLGAFGGSVLVLVLLGDAASLGATVPTGNNLLGAFAGELLFTFLLVFAVLQIPSGRDLNRWWLLLPGVVVGVSTFVIGPISGSSLNPARTIAPAVLSGTFTDLWLYLSAVPLGGILAVPAAATVARLGAHAGRERPRGR